jgi:hypothetical protein
MDLSDHEDGDDGNFLQGVKMSLKRKSSRSKSYDAFLAEMERVRNSFLDTDEDCDNEVGDDEGGDDKGNFLYIYVI